jgi:hypothetical protein
MDWSVIIHVCWIIGSIAFLAGSVLDLMRISGILK